MERVGLVSVPLRGLWFLSRPRHYESPGRNVCFRPLAGIMVLINELDLSNIYSAVKFPSPCGDYGSYLNLSGMVCVNFRKGFRPLAGIMVLIHELTTLLWMQGIDGFRPLAGIMVLISYSVERGCSGPYTSFRPLAGIMVLILADEGRAEFRDAQAAVSVPLRGLWFLSLPIKAVL